MKKWIVPCNIKYFNVIKAFEKLNEVYWKQSKNVSVGDTVYIYVSAPISALKYECAVTETNSPTNNIDDSEFVLDDTNFGNYGRYMKLELVSEFDTELLRLETLKRFGLSNVQGPSIAKKELVDYIVTLTSKKQRVLFCNIAYMKEYRGITTDDIPVHGGSYVSETRNANEKYNFASFDRKVYGFVETKHRDGYLSGKPNELHIENIDATYKNKDEIEGVTVVFCAKPKGKQTVIVGWYENATVYRNRMVYDRGEEDREYNIFAETKNVHLIEEKKRIFEIPRTKNKNDTGFGQSNLWYGNEEKDKAFKQEVLNYLDEIRKGNVDSEQEYYKVIDNEIKSINTYPNISETDKEILTKQRIGQGYFRQKLIERDGGCLICGLRNKNLLLASHIKPWSECDSKEEKLNPNNGLLLCAIHDKLFDKGLITFDEQGHIIISQSVSPQDQKILGIDEDFSLNMNEEMKSYMKWHKEDSFSKVKRVKHEKYGVGEIVKEESDSISVKFYNEKEVKQFIKEALKNGKLQIDY